MNRWLWIALLVVLLLLLVGCRADTGEDPAPRVSPTSMAGRWDAVPGDVQAQVCAAAQEQPDPETVDTGSGQIPEGPDWQGMLEVLVFNGMARGDAAALLPYAANECI